MPDKHKSKGKVARKAAHPPRSTDRVRLLKPHEKTMAQV